MITIQVAASRYDIDAFPPECPRCHRAIAPVHQIGSGAAFSSDSVDYFHTVFVCPNCAQAFFGLYRASTFRYQLWGTEPTEPTKHAFGLVDSLSPQFLAVYNEASAAEAFGLKEIAGLAYRKSLEFLVKDYCIRLVPTDEEKIKASFLSAVIRTYFKDTMIGKAAERATWLGNDEAHYVRKWEQHDISSLKALLRMVINGMNEKLEYDQLMASFEASAT